MRTSNKILLGTLLFVMLVFAFPVILVRAKFAGGNFTKQTLEINKDSDLYSFNEPIKSISASNLGNILIVPADSLRLKVWREKDSLVRYHVKDGVLFIESDTAKISEMQAGNRAYTHIELFVPALDSIYARNCHLQIRGNSDTTRLIPSYNLQLNSADITILDDGSGAANTFIDHLKVNAIAGSNINFMGGLRILNGSFKMTGSGFEDNMSVSFEKLSFQADSTASIRIKGHNLRKATIISTE